MFRQLITRIVVGFALICASCAWSGWVFLHSVGDPHRTERVAAAILDNASARNQIAKPLTDQLLAGLDLNSSTTATIRNAVAASLDDPSFVGNFVAAFGSAQANAMGVDDPRPTTIDAGALVSAVRSRLATVQPEIAAMIPQTSASIDLPVIKNGAVKSLRDLAERWTNLLGALALALLGLMLVVGHRRTVLRSFGFWAILTGAFWAVAPRLAPWLARQASPDTDALVKATVTALAGPITAAATALVITGAIALVLCYVVLGFDLGHGDARRAPVAATPPIETPTPAHVLGSTPTRTSVYAMTRTDEVPLVQPYDDLWATANELPAMPEPAPLLLIRPLDLPSSLDSLLPVSDAGPPADWV